VLLVLDGLGWEQLQERRALAATLCSMAGGPITTIVPSTTAAALTSITTGLAPGEHGIVGYRISYEGDVLNILRWNSARGDCRRLYLPEVVQTHQPFAGHRPPAVTRAEFVETGFTGAHLRGSRFCGYRVTSTLVHHVVEAARRGEPFVYAYYEASTRWRTSTGSARSTTPRSGTPTGWWGICWPPCREVACCW